MHRPAGPLLTTDSFGQRYKIWKLFVYFFACDLSGVVYSSRTWSLSLSCDPVFDNTPDISWQELTIFVRVRHSIVFLTL